MPQVHPEMPSQMQGGGREEELFKDWTIPTERPVSSDEEEKLRELIRLREEVPNPNHDPHSNPNPKPNPTHE